MKKNVFSRYVAAGFSLRKNEKQNVAAPFRVRKIKEKKHRLPLEYYKGKISVFYTLCIKDSKKIFTDKKTVDNFIKILEECIPLFKCTIPVYCFMPDHLHMIISGLEDKSNIWKCVVLFKQKTGYYLSNNFKNVRWQKDFYDHIIRRSETLSNIVRYILQNPVRKGIVERWKDYPFSGSIGIKLEDVLNGIYD